MEERFKDVPGYEGLYQASDLGRVKSLERKVKGRPMQGLRIVKEKILKAGIALNGRLQVSLSHNNKPKSFFVHQLVAMAFLNHIPCGYRIVVDHIDFDPLNNNLSNLRLISNRENTNKNHLLHTSKYTGVHWNKILKKWEAQIQINGKRRYLGLFPKELDAWAAYENILNQIL